jgi:hypothetical protein
MVAFGVLLLRDRKVMIKGRAPRHPRAWSVFL